MEGMIANEQGYDPKASAQRPFDTHLSTRTLRNLGIPVHTQDFKSWWSEASFADLIVRKLADFCRKRELHAFRH